MKERKNKDEQVKNLFFYLWLYLLIVVLFCCVVGRVAHLLAELVKVMLYAWFLILRLYLPRWLLVVSFSLSWKENKNIKTVLFSSQLSPNYFMWVCDGNWSVFYCLVVESWRWRMMVRVYWPNWGLLGFFFFPISQEPYHTVGSNLEQKLFLLFINISFHQQEHTSKKQFTSFNSTEKRAENVEMNAD